MENNIALTIRNLEKSYGSLMALKKVSFEIQSGEIFGLLGPNGAGKSTLINIVTGVSLRNSGEVLVFGKDVEADYLSTRMSVGAVPQEIVSDGYFTVIELMKIQSGFFNTVGNDVHIEEILKRLQLWDHREKKVEHLSGGMKRRLLIAKALVHRPSLVILDEPTAGVDVKLRLILWDYIRELNEQGTTILLTTHYIEEAEKLCDRVGILHNGNIVALNTVENVIQHNESKTLEEVFIRLTEEN